MQINLFSILDSGGRRHTSNSMRGGTLLSEHVYPWGGKVTVRGIKNKGTTVEVIIPVTTGEPL
jgi:hypothetical protein